MNLGYLGLGSNVGDRRANLQASVEELWSPAGELLVQSRQLALVREPGA